MQKVAMADPCHSATICIQIDGPLAIIGNSFRFPIIPSKTNSFCQAHAFAKLDTGLAKASGQ